MGVSVKGSGGGGISSSDVTATRAQVVAGYTTVTSDSNDEVVEGTFEGQTKTATANGVISPDAGKYLSSVTVAIPVYNKEYA